MRWVQVAALAATTLAASCHRTDNQRANQEAEGQFARVACPGQERSGGIRGRVSTLPSLIEDGDAVFFVGNSFLSWQGRLLSEWVAAVGRAMSPPVRIATGADILFGNTPLGQFLSHPATREALASHRYKVFVLQGEEFEPVDHKAEFHQAVRDFNRAITAAGGRTVLFMTWEFSWRTFIDRLAASYDEIGRELDLPVIPVGLVYKDLEDTTLPHPTPFWLTTDSEHPQGGLHENEKGSAVNTYATFAMLTGRNPLGMNFTAAGNSNSGELMRYLSDMAWNRVKPRLEAGCK
jgi:hypothetical protein